MKSFVQNNRGKIILASGLLAGIGSALLFPTASYLSYLAFCGDAITVGCMVGYKVALEKDKAAFKYGALSSIVGSAAAFLMAHFALAATPVVATYLFTTSWMFLACGTIHNAHNNCKERSNNTANTLVAVTVCASVCAGLAQFSLLNPISLAVVFAANIAISGSGYSNIIEDLTIPITDRLCDLLQPKVGKEVGGV